ncbi:MAG: alpha/beta hydrolase family protein, partial [Bacteroidales bacterium]
RLDPEEKGWDLSAPRYVDMFGESTKKAGVGRLDPAKPGVQSLQFDDASFSRVMKAKTADTYLYTRETYKDPADYYATDATLKAGRKLTSLDKQVEPFEWSNGSRLIEYTVTLGKGGPTRKLQGSLFLPANYEKGKSYPTIVYIYEKLTQGHNGFTTPTANGFNKSVYTSNGYAVLMPDITYRLNDPGVSAVTCITTALKTAIATGVVDPKRVGLQGHSWGGYQTAFTVTQTNMFAAAVAGAPLTNMVSMYSLIYKNSGGTNQAIFETSQGRFLGGYWDNWDAYVRNSPVNFAKNVTTPLIILHNDKDGAVDFTQGVEYYNTLRRMGKKVVMLEYPGENHGLAKPANQQDYTVRMKEFFDYYLKGAPAPDWWTKGVSRLEMEDHIKQRLDQLKKAKPAAPPTKPTVPTQGTKQ